MYTMTDDLDELVFLVVLVLRYPQFYRPRQGRFVLSF